MDEASLREMREQINEALGESDLSTFQDTLLKEVNSKQRKQIVSAIAAEVQATVNAKLKTLEEQIRVDSEKDREVLTQAFKEALQQAVFNIPTITVPKPEVTVNVPPIQVPELPAPQVTVAPADVIVPEFPKELNITGLTPMLQDILEAVKAIQPFSADELGQSPIPVMLIDPANNSPYKARGGGSMSISGSAGISDPPGNPIGYQQLSVTTGAQTLTPPAGAARAVITVEGDTVRWRDDGAAPTSSVGLPLTAFASIELNSAGSINNFQVIKDANATTTPILNISYYKRS